jgi:branched-chain amino acid transport system substrate-binding protein
MVALAAQTTDLHGMGLENCQGWLMCLPCYLDLNERTRAFTQRVLPKTQPAYPSVTHAGANSGGSDKAKASGKKPRWT